MPPPSETGERPPSRPGRLRRAAAGAFYIPAGFVFLLGRPRLWPLALLPVLLTAAGLFAGLVLGLFTIRRVEAAFEQFVAGLPELASVLVTLVLWGGTLAAGMLLGLAVALLLGAPLTERLSRRVEQLAGGVVPDAACGTVWEVVQALRGSLYFLAAAPGIFVLSLVPFVGPPAAALWGAYALAHQLTDAPLTRRGLGFRARRAWHREWRAESIGFGLAGLVALVVPAANLLLGPALAVGGTLLVVELEHLRRDAGTVPAAEPARAGSRAPSQPETAA